MNQKEIFERQLALDYSCNIEDVRSKEHIFTRKEYRTGRRIFRGDDCLVKIACVNGKLLVSAEEEMLDWCKKELAFASSAWFFEYSNLYKLDLELRKRGHRIGSTHHFYLPGGVERFGGECPKAGIELQWYEKEELEQFRENNPYPEALSFIKESPDMLAVSAVLDGNILGMAYLANPGLYYHRNLTGSAMRTHLSGKRNGFLARLRYAFLALDHSTAYTAAICFF